MRSCFFPVLGIKPGALLVLSKHCLNLTFKWEIYSDCDSASHLSSPHGLAPARAFDLASHSFFLSMLFSRVSGTFAAFVYGRV